MNNIPGEEKQWNMVWIIVQQAKLKEKENFAILEVVIVEEAEEEMVGAYSPMSKVSQRMTFNITIFNATEGHIISHYWKLKK